MDRQADEVVYVLQSLRLARQEVVAHPEWFEPDALDRIDKVILSMQEQTLANAA